MKSTLKLLRDFAVIAVLSWAVVMLITNDGHQVHAQAPSQLFFSMPAQSDISLCKWPSGVGAGMTAFCPIVSGNVPVGLGVGVGGGAFTLFVPQQGSAPTGVTSFKGRTGAVTPSQDDYNAGQVTGSIIGGTQLSLTNLKCGNGGTGNINQGFATGTTKTGPCQATVFAITGGAQ